MIDQTKPRSRAWRVMARIAQAIAFSTVEAIAAIQLGGPIGVLLWVIVAWNIGVAVVIVWGIAILADDHLREAKADAP